MPDERPAERYGDRPALPRRTVLLAVGALAAAFTGYVVWVGVGAADRDVRWDDVGFEILGDDRVEVTFDVVKDPDATAVCSLTALSASYAVVGITTVEVGPSQQDAVRTRAQVPTQERAVTGVVDECALR